MKCIVPALLAVLIGALLACSKSKPPATTDRTPELLSLAEAIVSDLGVISMEKAHSHSIVHSEVQLTADVSVKFDSEGDAQKISSRIRSVFENAGYTTLFFNEQSQG
jgi:Co/Zn/Cd efflux system component